MGEQEKIKIDKMIQVIGRIQRNFQCPICLEVVSSAFRTDCGHLFCKGCIKETLRKKNSQCPLCNKCLTRRSIFSDDTTQRYIDLFYTLIERFQEETGVNVIKVNKKPNDGIKSDKKKESSEPCNMPSTSSKLVKNVEIMKKKEKKPMVATRRSQRLKPSVRSRRLAADKQTTTECSTNNNSNENILKIRTDTKKSQKFFASALEKNSHGKVEAWLNDVVNASSPLSTDTNAPNKTLNYPKIILNYSDSKTMLTPSSRSATISASASNCFEILSGTTTEDLNNSNDEISGTPGIAFPNAAVLGNTKPATSRRAFKNIIGESSNETNPRQDGYICMFKKLGKIYPNQKRITAVAKFFYMGPLWRSIPNESEDNLKMSNVKAQNLFKTPESLQIPRRVVQAVLKDRERRSEYWGNSSYANNSKLTPNANEKMRLAISKSTILHQDTIADQDLNSDPLGSAYSPNASVAAMKFETRASVEMPMKELPDSLNTIPPSPYADKCIRNIDRSCSKNRPFNEKDKIDVTLNEKEEHQEENRNTSTVASRNLTLFSGRLKSPILDSQLEDFDRRAFPESTFSSKSLRNRIVQRRSLTVNSTVSDSDPPFTEIREAESSIQTNQFNTSGSKSSCKKRKYQTTTEKFEKIKRTRSMENCRTSNDEILEENETPRFAKNLLKTRFSEVNLLSPFSNALQNKKAKGYKERKEKEGKESSANLSAVSSPVATQKGGVAEVVEKTQQQSSETHGSLAKYDISEDSAFLAMTKRKRMTRNNSLSLAEELDSEPKSNGQSQSEPRFPQRPAKKVKTNGGPVSTRSSKRQRNAMPPVTARQPVYSKIISKDAETPDLSIFTDISSILLDSQSANTKKSMHQKCLPKRRSSRRSMVRDFAHGCQSRVKPDKFQKSIMLDSSFESSNNAKETLSEEKCNGNNNNNELPEAENTESPCSRGSNKENRSSSACFEQEELANSSKNAEEQVTRPSLDMDDSLMNITMDEMRLKMFEKDFFGFPRDEVATPQAIPSTKAKGRDTLNGDDDYIESSQKMESPSTRRNSLGNTLNEIESKVSGAKSKKKEEEQQLCLMCTGLMSTEVEQLMEFTRIFNAKFVTQFEPKVTHVIVDVKENGGAPKTLKYLQGVAHGKWIVGIQWVEACIKKRKLLAEEPYEAVDHETLAQGPRNSRLRSKGLLEDFAFFCIEPFMDITLAQYQDLIRATNGTVVSSMKALTAQKDKLKIIAIAEPSEQDDIASWHRKTGAVVITEAWALDCISRYSLISIYSYLHELLPENHLLTLGFPAKLIEPDDQDSTADASA